MKFILNIVFLLSTACFVNAQDTLFPVAKNGKWGLVKSNGEYVLKQQYNFLEYFSGANKFVYEQHGKKGVIDAKGNVLTAAQFDHIVLFDSIWFSTVIDFKWDLKNGSSPHFNHQFDSVQFIATNIFALYNGPNCTIYQGQLRKKSDQNFTQVSTFGNSLLLAKNTDGKQTVFNENLDIIAQSVDLVQIINQDYAILHDGDVQTVFDIKNAVVTPKSYNSISHQYGSVFYCNRGDNFLIFDASQNGEYKAPQLDQVSDLEYPNLVYLKNNRIGLWNLQKGQSILDAEYEGILADDNGFFITAYDKKGFANRAGKIIIPVKYKDIEVYDHAFVAKNSTGSYLFGRGGKLLSKESFESIRVFDKHIKCYNQKKMLLIKLENNGQVKSSKIYENYMQVSLDKARLPRRQAKDLVFGQSGPEKTTDSYAAGFGWYRPVLTRMLKDSLVEYRGKWGLRDSTDTLIKPQFSDIAIFEDQGVTQVYKNKLIKVQSKIAQDLLKKEWGYKIGKKSLAIYQVPFRLVDHHTGKPINSNQLSALNMKDFKRCALARGFFKTPVLVDKQGNIIKKDLLFYGSYNEDILRVCESGEPVLTDEKGQSICATSYFFHLTGALNYKVGQDEGFYNVKKGKWFYYNSEGKQLNAEPFEAAEEFYKSRAIVKKGGKWGVVDTAMNIIIPFEYNQVKRVVVNGDLFFEVRNNVNEHYIYQKKEGKVDPTAFNELKHFYNGKWFARTKGNSKWALVDTNFNQLSDFEFDFVFPFKDGFATVVKKGKKSVIDASGSEILPYYKVKKIRALGFDRYALESRRGTTVINGIADTLIASKDCREVIESNENYLIYKGSSGRVKFLRFNNKPQTNEELLPKKTNILSYSMASELFLVQKKGKKKLYSIQEERYVNKKPGQVVSIGEESMIYEQDKGMFGFLSLSGDTLLPAQYEEPKHFKNGWAFSDQQIINSSGEQIYPEDVFRVFPVDENFAIITQSGLGLIDPYAQPLIPPNYVSIKPYNSIFYLAEKKNNTFDLYTLDGKKINDKAYREIKAISPEGIIVKSGGYDYLFDGFLNKSLSFQKIQPVSGNRFLLNERKHIGLYNADGENIIPVQYHKITPERGHLQVSFFNSFGYYDQTGNTLADPKN